MRRPAASVPRSLADQLRGWSDERLAHLFAVRPDLTTPAPHDFGQLASRATVRASLSRALDRLTLLELTVLDALVVAGQTTPSELAGFVAAEESVVEAAIEALRDLALAWEPSGGLRAVTGAADALGRGPGASGLLPRSTPTRSVAEVETELGELSEPARALLTHVVEAGGEADPGRARRTVLPAEATSPAEELLARRLLVARGDDRVVAPGEVGIALRGGHTTAGPAGVVPGLATAERDAATLDRVAAGAALEAVRRVELLLDRWGAQPPAVLRSGGLGVRELRAAATHLLVEDRVAALLVETAAAAGLVAARADTRGASVWVPTDAFDTWTGQSPAERWVVLARTWLASHRTPALVGTRDPAGKGLNALSADLSSPWVAETRRMTLAALAELPAGTTLAAGTGLASLVSRLAVLRPRRPSVRAEQVGHALAEAAELGVTGLDGIAVHGRALLAEAGDPGEVLAPLLPAPVEHVVIQADLTAVAPGPLESALARRLATVADVESRGGATTYRFTAGSVRRALDAGWTAAETHAFLASVSRTPVPQPLTYLVDDTVRTFGTVRVGHAEAFLRADDEAALTELLHHQQAAGLGLRRIAPTVLVSTTPVDVLLPRLRELGAAPVVEAPDGTVQVSRPDQLRARTPRDRRDPVVRARAEAHETARIASVVAAVRSGDRATATTPRVAAEPLTPSGALAALREALEAAATVVIGYVDGQGFSGERIVEPRALEGGTLTALDYRAGAERTFAVHRITTVRPAS